MTDNIQAAIVDLEARRDDIQKAIDVLRGLNGSRPTAKSEKAEKVRRVVQPKLFTRRASKTDDLCDALLAALSAGPMSPRDIAATVANGDMPTAKYAFARLQLRGLVRGEGVTNSRKWMLAKPTKTAKEAP